MAVLGSRRSPGMRAHAGRGFTLIELLVTLTLVGLVAMVAMPLYELSVTRRKETELRESLRAIRQAIDAYKVAADTGEIEKETGGSGYPPSLRTLVTGVAVQHQASPSGGSLAAAVAAASAASSARARPTRLYFLRRVPRDPFADDPSVPDEQTWQLRSYRSPPDRPEAGDDVFDVTSKSPRVGLNGLPYAQW